MQNFTAGDYALNKHSGGIVYRFADQIIEVTLADFLAENPGLTAADFQRLKDFSDRDYLEQDRREDRQSRKNVPLDGVDLTEHCAVPSPETALFSGQDESERREARIALAKRAMDKLTSTQRRRYLMYHVKGLSTREIAAIEGVNQSKIMNSLAAAEKKIKKILAAG